MVVLTSFPPPAEGVRLRQENTQAHVQGKMLGNGVLFVAESRVSWVGVDGEGFSLEYPAISLHAVSKDLSSFPHECVYLMVEGDLGKGEQSNSGTESSEEESGSVVSEMRFIPADKAALDPIYRCLCECQVLHPDQTESFSDDGEGEEEEEEEGFYEEEEAADNLSPQGQDMLTRMEAMLAAGDDGIERDQPAIGAQANGDGGTGAIEPMDTAQFEDAD